MAATARSHLPAHTCPVPKPMHELLYIRMAILNYEAANVQNLQTAEIKYQGIKTVHQKKKHKDLLFTAVHHA